MPNIGFEGNPSAFGTSTHQQPSFRQRIRLDTTMMTSQRHFGHVLVLLLSGIASVTAFR